MTEPFFLNHTQGNRETSMSDPLAGRDERGILARADGASIAYRRVAAPPATIRVRLWFFCTA